MHALLHSVPPILQATIDPRLHQRLLDTHRQLWVSLLWDNCSFLLGPGAHNVLFVPSKSLFPQNNPETLVSPETRVFSLNNHRQENAGSHQKKDTPHPRTKEKPQQDDRRGEIAFRIKFHTHQRCSEGSNKNCMHQETPQRLSQTCLCLSVSCGGMGHQWLWHGLWVQHIWVWHKPSPRESPLIHLMIKKKKKKLCLGHPLMSICLDTKIFMSFAHGKRSIHIPSPKFPYHQFFNHAYSKSLTIQPNWSQSMNQCIITNLAIPPSK